MTHPFKAIRINKGNRTIFTEIELFYAGFVVSFSSVDDSFASTFQTLHIFTSFQNEEENKIFKPISR